MGGFYMRDEVAMQQQMAERPLLQQYGEQCADTDGLAKYMVSDGHESYEAFGISPDALKVTSGMAPATRAQADVAELCERVAELETQVTGRDATIAGLRTEVLRLQDELCTLRLAHLSALQTPSPSETPRVNPFTHGWATNWRLR